MHFYQKSFPLGDLSAPFTRTVIKDLRGWPGVEKLFYYNLPKKKIIYCFLNFYFFYFYLFILFFSRGEAAAVPM